MLTVKDRAKKERLDEIMKFILNYIVSNNSIELFLNMTDLEFKVVREFGITEFQFISVLNYLDYCKELKIEIDKGKINLINPYTERNILYKDFGIELE